MGVATQLIFPCICISMFGRFFCTALVSGGFSVGLVGSTGPRQSFREERDRKKEKRGPCKRGELERVFFAENESVASNLKLP